MIHLFNSLHTQLIYLVHTTNESFIQFTQIVIHLFIRICLWLIYLIHTACHSFIQFTWIVIHLLVHTDGPRLFKSHCP